MFQIIDKAFLESGNLMTMMATIVYSVHLINFDDELLPETLKCCYEYLTVLLGMVIS